MTHCCPTRRSSDLRRARVAGARGASQALGQRVDDRARRSGAPGRTRARRPARGQRSEEHTSELQSLMRSSYAVFCLKKKQDEIQTGKATDTTLITHPTTIFRLP